MRAMILAAGRGVRLNPWTLHVPKPLLCVGSTPLIVHLIQQLAAQHFTEIVINLGHLGAKLAWYLGSGKHLGVQLEYTYEDPILETGGGIKNALPLLGDEPFLVVSGDLWTEFPFAQLHSLRPALAHLILVQNPHLPQGFFDLVEDKVVLQQAGRWDYAGIGVFHPDLFAAVAPGIFPLMQMLEPHILRGQVTGSHWSGVWHNVGTLQEFEEACRIELSR